jgi:Tfp pilus assembly protein PilE
MKEILLLILCFILFLLIVSAILFHRTIAHWRNIIRQMQRAREARRMAEEDAYFKRTSQKNYQEDDTPDFDADYFKKQRQKTEKPNTATRRTMRTDSGVTIIDERQQQDEKKIFDDDEGEYIEYSEVK